MRAGEAFTPSAKSSPCEVFSQTTATFAGFGSLPAACCALIHSISVVARFRTGASAPKT